MTTNITIATRKSKMALIQAHFVKDQLLAQQPGLNIDILPTSTTGDNDQSSTIASMGGKAVFVKTIEQALLNRTADIAVHCVKDMSVYPTKGLTIAAICQRDDPRDALLTLNNITLSQLPTGACIGTGSPRRICQIKQIRSDLTFQPIRGNVLTRLEKLKKGEVDALMLSYCGLERLGLTDQASEIFDPLHFIPAIGQGALALQCRTEDSAIQQLLATISHKSSALCISAEQATNQRLGGNCLTPIGVHAFVQDNILYLNACVGDVESAAIVYSKLSGPLLEPQLLGIQAADELISKGANGMLQPEN